jgi:hypothetical protein
MKEVFCVHIMDWCDLVGFFFFKLLIALYAIYIAGAKYELPKYVLSEPTNLIRDG